MVVLIINNNLIIISSFSLFFSGILQHLDYIKDLGVAAVLLAPMYKSSKRNYGHDIVNHKEVDSPLGSLEQFEHLVTALHEKGKMEFIE